MEEDERGSFPGTPVIGEVPIIDDLMGMMIPGRPVVTNFNQMDEGHLVVDVEMPREIASLSFFLLPGQELDDSKGVSIHWAAPPFEDFQLLGTLAPNRVSGTFYTGWPTLHGMEEVDVVRIGIALEDLDTIKSLDEAVLNGYIDRVGVARLIADNLFNFCGSFAEETPDGERIILPPEVLNAWLARFEEKLSVDPDFLFRGRG